jgi:hypothetical protein
MANLREKPSPGLNFLVDLGTGATDSPETVLADVIFPEAQLQFVEYRNGNWKGKFPSQGTDHDPLWKFDPATGWDQVRLGDQSAVRKILVQLQNENHSEIVLTWKFGHSRPVNHQFSPLNALGIGAFMETLEVAFESMAME